MASRVVLIGSRRRGDLYFIRPSTKAEFPKSWGASREIVLVGGRSKSKLIHNPG